MDHRRARVRVTVQILNVGDVRPRAAQPIARPSADIAYTAWPRHVRRRERPVVDAETEAGELARRIGLAAECLRNEGRRPAVEPYALFYLSSFMRMTHGLGIRGRGGK